MPKRPAVYIQPVSLILAMLYLVSFGMLGGLLGVGSLAADGVLIVQRTTNGGTATESQIQVEPQRLRAIHHRQLAPLNGYPGHILCVDEHSPARGPLEARHQTHEGGLTR